MLKKKNKYPLCPYCKGEVYLYEHEFDSNTDEFEFMDGMLVEGQMICNSCGTEFPSLNISMYSKQIREMLLTEIEKQWKQRIGG